MNFDMQIFNNLMIPIVAAACLIVGFIIKKWVHDVNNKWIPTILAVLGAILAVVAKGDLTLEIAVSGAFSGLASTGLHQAFTQLIGGGKNGD